MKTIVLTGGGTAGHVTPNIALMNKLKSEGYKIVYIGSKDGIEKELITKIGIEYHAISSGKLRRYIDKKNITDMFRVIKGIKEASSLLKKIEPSIVFSKGGFVSVPVVIAAKMRHIPVIIHESDITPGLANKIAIPFASAICTTFPETAANIQKSNCILTGSPIRASLFLGDKEKGLSMCSFKRTKPILLVIGGSLGSVKINTVIRESLSEILKEFNVIHICGKGNIDDKYKNTENYKQYEYISDELPNLFACADIIVSRAGSNSICEFLALNKPNLLIPLTKAQSRGDQILNAMSFEKQNFSRVLYEEDLNIETLCLNIKNLYENRDIYINSMKNAEISNGVEKIIELIKKYSKV